MIEAVFSEPEIIEGYKEVQEESHNVSTIQHFIQTYKEWKEIVHKEMMTIFEEKGETIREERKWQTIKEVEQVELSGKVLSAYNVHKESVIAENVKVKMFEKLGESQIREVVEEVFALPYMMKRFKEISESALKTSNTEQFLKDLEEWDETMKVEMGARITVKLVE